MQQKLVIFCVHNSHTFQYLTSRAGWEQHGEVGANDMVTLVKTVEDGIAPHGLDAESITSTGPEASFE